QTRPCITVR
nr:immunoglobulin heavy chain junction region [Homo sapiens]